MAPHVVSASVGAVAVLAMLSFACSGGGGSGPTPEPPDNGFARATTDFIEAVSDGDVERYRSLVSPDQRSTSDERIREILGSSADLDGCSTSDREYRMTEDVQGVSVDVTFSPPCGDFRTTDACNVFYRRFDGDWSVVSWTCSLNIPDGASP